MKNASKLLVLFLLVSVFLLGCSSQNFASREQATKIIDRVITSTDKAIANKDTRLARNTWSEISEYGVKAGSMGEKELEDKLGLLASCYENLLKYLETSEEEYYERFQESYNHAIEELNIVIDAQE